MSISPDGPMRLTAQELVAAKLRRQILTGELTPGTRLLQNDVAAVMRTSTTPVREALRELAAEGLVDLDPHRGVVVHTPTSRELDEIYELRLFLEPLGIKKAVAAIEPSEIESAEGLCRLMEAETATGVWTNLNRQFHEILLAASRSPLLVAILTNLRDRSSMYVALSLGDGGDRMSAGNSEHRSLLDAMKAMDVERAIAVTTKHLASTAGLAHSQLTGSPARDGHLIAAQPDSVVYR